LSMNIDSVGRLELFEVHGVLPSRAAGSPAFCDQGLCRFNDARRRQADMLKQGCGRCRCTEVAEPDENVASVEPFAPALSNGGLDADARSFPQDRKSTRLNS